MLGGPSNRFPTGSSAQDCWRSNSHWALGEEGVRLGWGLVSLRLSLCGQTSEYTQRHWVRTQNGKTARSTKSKFHQWTSRWELESKIVDKVMRIFIHIWMCRDSNFAYIWKRSSGYSNFQLLVTELRILVMQKNM